MKKIYLTISLLTLFIAGAYAQSATIKGKVTDETGQGLAGATVVIQGTTTGASVDFDGNYAFTTDAGTYTLIVSFVGYETITKSVTVSAGDNVQNFKLGEGDLQLEGLVVTGSRNPNRTAVDTPVPVDVIDVNEIAKSSGQVSLNDILNYVAPSFTSQAQTVSDGTDHIDPASLRGLGPDQVLVLINGKRRHTSSLINVNGTVGAGSVGTDLNAIPTAAIERVEVLRDGAAAQYGSDAIAGVINIILKKGTDKLDFSVSTGANMSSLGNHQDGGMDGERIQFDANYGLSLGDKGGFINFTGTIATRNPAWRNATNLEQIYDVANAVEQAYIAQNGGSIASMTTADYQAGAALLGTNYLSGADQAAIAALDPNSGTFDTDLGALLPNGGTGQFATYQELDDAQFAARGLERNDFRFKVGTAELREGKFFANMSLPLSENAEFYSFGGISYRQGLGFGFLREPWRPKANVASNPNGFLPGIQSDILDKSFAIGLKGKTQNGWNVDFSNTYGANSFDYTVVNSANASLKGSSPRDFEAGSNIFQQNTTNLDFSKFYNDTFNGLNMAFGAEYRVENYQIIAGAENSYLTYDNNKVPTVGGVGGATNALGESLPGTSQVYAGFTPQNAVNKYRNSIAGYADLEVDFTDWLLISFAARYEDFSDFGNTFNYKLATRVKATDNINFRGAYSTGFRAPSLHQQFFSRSSTIFNASGVAEEVGLFRNDSELANLLGIDKLKQETSESMSLGATANVGAFSLTVDAYQITIEDRIVLSGKFTDGGDPVLTAIFAAAGADKAQFLANAVDTKNTGIDIVLGHKLDIGSNMSLNSSFAATFSTVEITNVNVPDKIAAAGLSRDFFDGQEEAFLTIARPRTKWNLTEMFTVDSWSVMLRLAYFGEVTDPDDFAGNPEGYTVDPLAVYAGKLITDLSVSKTFNESTTITLGANNLLDVYPDENRPGSQSNASFPYSRRTSQFGFMGRYVFARVSFTL
ncbi:MAG: TonB-dependent receptor [Cyclobacteriaceae bacterium]|nr:TonB-dependent receptor [Cyclobacteriaceae bacterium]